MALSRKFLAAMDIPAEKIDEIIAAHAETVNALKDERDSAQKKLSELEAQIKDVEAVKKELEEAKATIAKSEDLEKKYKDLKSEYDNFKTDTETKATKAKKEAAYRKLLKEAGVSEKRLDSVIKVSGSNIDSIEFDDKGEIKDADKLTEGAKKEWADFITITRQEGADVSNPPKGDGSGEKTSGRAAQLVAQYRNEHYGNPTKEE